MAVGAPGANGVWQYGEDDSQSTFSALLNKVASTTDTQIGVDRGRLTSLENTRPGTAGKPLQFAANTVTTSATAQVTVTYPVGRFSVAPLVTAQVVNIGNVSVAYLTNVTSATSFDVGAFTIGGGRLAAPVHWHAVQMTSGTAAG